MSKKEKPSQKPGSSNRYLKYSGMVFQLFIMLLIAAWIGKKIDAHFQTKMPYATALLLILALVGYLVKLAIDLSKEEDE
jgi:putative Mn2+ efflux pump MntP